MPKKSHTIVEPMKQPNEAKGKSSTIKMGRCFANSPMQTAKASFSPSGKMTDALVELAFARNLDWTNTNADHPTTSWTMISMAQGTVYWGFETVNVMFTPHGFLDNKVDVPQIYKPPAFNHVVKQDQWKVEGLENALPPLSSFLPNFIAPSSISPPKQEYPGDESKSLEYARDLHKNASNENKLSPDAALRAAFPNRAATHDAGLGRYALGKSAYTETGAPPPTDPKE